MGNAPSGGINDNDDEDADFFEVSCSVMLCKCACMRKLRGGPWTTWSYVKNLCLISCLYLILSYFKLNLMKYCCTWNKNVVFLFKNK